MYNSPEKRQRLKLKNRLFKIKELGHIEEKFIKKLFKSNSPIFPAANHNPLSSRCFGACAQQNQKGQESPPPPGVYFFHENPPPGMYLSRYYTVLKKF